MQQQLSIHIPTPCHENWDAMTPVQQGRFCQSCAKQVIDFSMMTDQEVLNYFTKNTGNTCGHFNSDQLQRPLQPIKKEKKKAWWVAGLMPLLMLFEKGKAQAKDSTATIDTTVNAQQVRTLIGDTIMAPLNNTIRGKVINAKGKPVESALINIDKVFTTKTDSTGLFNLTIPQTTDAIIVEIFKPGYDTQKINITADITENIITLHSADDNVTLDTSFKYIAPDSNINLTTMISGFTTAVPDYPTSPITDYFKNIIGASQLTVFPTTINVGEKINIIIRNAGEYYLQLVDALGKILLVEKITTQEVKSSIPINLPPSLAIGAYFIYVVDERKKKKYIKKIFVI